MTSASSACDSFLASVNFPLDWIKITKALIYGSSRKLFRKASSEIIHLRVAQLSSSIWQGIASQEAGTECCTLIAFYLGFTSVFISRSVLYASPFATTIWVSQNAHFLCVQNSKWKTQKIFSDGIVLAGGNIGVDFFLCRNANNKKRELHK